MALITPQPTIKERLRKLIATIKPGECIACTDAAKEWNVNPVALTTAARAIGACASHRSPGSRYTQSVIINPAHYETPKATRRGNARKD